MMRYTSVLKILLIAAFLCGGSLVSFAQSKMGLPDVSSGIAYNDLRFPEDKWSETLLAALEAGPRYLKKDNVFEIAQAPANDSDITKNELDLLRKFEKEERDELTVKLILEENAKDPFIAIFNREGLFAVEKKNENTQKLIVEVIAEIGYFILREKKHFARARPTQLAPDLTLVIDVPPHPAYPSGHAGQSYAAALILSKMDPDNKDRYLKLAEEVAHRREIAGVHYPSDSDAGRKLAEQVVEKLLTVPQFDAKFQRAKETFVKPTPKE